MNILVTGGTGLIGRAFIDRFTQYKFTVVTRCKSKAGRVLPQSVELIESLAQLDNLNRFDAVINLAGEPIIDRRWSHKQKVKVCQSRWQTSQQLVDLFTRSEHPPKVFLSGSAIGVYGPGGELPLTENTALKKQDFPTEVCIEWENIARQAEPYTRVVLLRTGIVLSARGGALRKMILPFKLGLGGPVGDGQQYMSWIHYQDHINAMNHLLQEGQLSGAFNLVAPEPVRNSVFTKNLARVLHRPAIFTLPAFLLRLLLGEASCLLLDSQKVIPESLSASGFRFSFPDLKMALSDILQHNHNKENP